jgi:glycosyltransferase involved in cell wall biosynthesis
MTVSSASPAAHGMVLSASEEPRVSVIVPAFNSEATLDETLASVRAQTHRFLEIIVIDDGSTDGTGAIAEEHAGDDARVRLIRKPNGGVASARNIGIAEATGTFIAPVDADDLWHPKKIERQLAALGSHENVGLVYCWFAKIDEESRITHLEGRSVHEGDVLSDLCLHSIVGNGSTPLMLRSAVVAAGGYDESLKARCAQGCEDYKLYLRIAENYDYALVRDYLVGYRQLQKSMSRDQRQMLRSRDLVMHEIGAARPDLLPQLQRGRARQLRAMISHSFADGERGVARELLQELIRTNPGDLLRHVARFPRKLAARLRPSPPDPLIGQPFQTILLTERP